MLDKINGILKNQSAVEGVMGLGFGSQIWNQLASNGYLQVIGITLPNFICSIGSIAFGGIDLRYISNDPPNPPKIHNIPTLNGTDYPTIEVKTIRVNNTSLNFPVINAIISTSYNKVSLGSFSTEFFTKLGANKTSDGNWIVPNPVDITLDVTTDSGPIIGITITSNLTCNSMSKGQCISIFDDKFGPLNNTIIIGALFVKNFNFVVNKAKSIIGIADRNNFCPTPIYTTTITSTFKTSQTPFISISLSHSTFQPLTTISQTLSKSSYSTFKPPSTTLPLTFKTSQTPFISISLSHSASLPLSTPLSKLSYSTFQPPSTTLPLTFKTSQTPFISISLSHTTFQPLSTISQTLSKSSYSTFQPPSTTLPLTFKTSQTPFISISHSHSTFQPLSTISQTLSKSSYSTSHPLSTSLSLTFTTSQTPFLSISLSHSTFQPLPTISQTLSKSSYSTFQPLSTTSQIFKTSHIPSTSLKCTIF
ncbi:hypothetical protein F8M41_003130 [Gigaspora margarita]|uniref:Peptidase A1 domain-containing protein n=1 Tax=Gigaspora margarita TaxID=4874 RepID=A0A8H4ES28_GIGMA|nr:hypothetical protein F8M41_003130 [Gigaspora margarita]